MPSSVEAREGGDYAELLRNVARAGNTPAACAQLLQTLRNTPGGTLLNRVNGLVQTALNDIDEHGEAMKALVVYAFAIIFRESDSSSIQQKMKHFSLMTMVNSFRSREKSERFLGVYKERE